MTASVPTCQSASALTPDAFCGKPATVVVSAICVHEHVRTGGLCLEHAAGGREHGCGACFRHDGHTCLVSLVEAEWVTAPNGDSVASDGVA